MPINVGKIPQVIGASKARASARVPAGIDEEASECPVCGNGKPSFWASVGGYLYLQCRGCGLVYLDRTPAFSELENFYNTAFQVDRKRQESKITGQRRSMLRVLEQLLPGKGRLLEIGCSYGHFLSKAKADGWEVEGVEISRSAADWAQEKLSLRVHSGTLEEVIPKLRGPYDAVAMFHVLEHAPEPCRVVIQAKQLLRPGGVLVIRTPNASSWIAKMCGATWEWLTPPAHIHLFSPVSLRILMERAGFHVESVTTRRGDAHNTAFELARGMSKRILGQKVVAPTAGSPPPSRRGWYRSIETLSDTIFRPIELLEAIYFSRRQLHPELLLSARVPELSI